MKKTNKLDRFYFFNLLIVKVRQNKTVNIIGLDFLKSYFFTSLSLTHSISRERERERERESL